MKRQVPGLHEAVPLPDGFFLVRVDFAQYRLGTQKPYLVLTLTVREPVALAGRKLATRLYCTDKALWKLNWFLWDFGYDHELLTNDQIDEGAIVGLNGVVRVSHSSVHGRTFLNVDGFAPAASWDEFRLQAAG